MSNWWVFHYINAGLQIVLISHIFWVIFSITLHELAHGWAAIWQGDDTPIRTGHMTASPLVHMGPQSLLMFAIVGIAWGAMPVDPSKFRWKRKGWMVVAAAGPALNLALAGAAIVLMTVWIRFGPQHEDYYRHVAVFFFVGAGLNITLAIFNLLPIPPLDGALIVSGMSFTWWRRFRQENFQIIGMFIVIALMISGVLDVLWVTGYNLAMVAGDALGSIAGNSPLHEVIYFGY